MSRSRDSGSGTGCKIDRMASAYDIPLEAKQLGTYWTRSEDRYSLRELAVYFNRRLLDAAMTRAGLNPLDGEVENTYRLLTDETVSQGMRTQARNRLEKNGVDAEGIESAFVSYQTVNRHLKNCLDVQREPDDSDPVETGSGRIEALRNRTTAVTETTLSQLATNGELAGGDLDAFVEITVSCSECGAYAPVEEFIENGGCDCEPTSE